VKRPFPPACQEDDRDAVFWQRRTCAAAGQAMHYHVAIVALQKKRLICVVGLLIALSCVCLAQTIIYNPGSRTVAHRAADTLSQVFWGKSSRHLFKRQFYQQRNK